MSKLQLAFAALALVYVSQGFAQAIYAANGPYRGYQQTSPSGVN